VQLERVLAVLQRVGGADRLPRQLPGAARGDEAAVQLVGEHGAEDEASCLRAEDHVRPARLRPLREQVGGLLERRRVGEQRHDVLEDDPGLRKIGHVADLGLQVLDPH